MCPPIIQEPFFALPVAAAPTLQNTIVTAPIVSSSVVATNQNEGPVLHDPIEQIATDEGEQWQPQIEEVPIVVAPIRSQRVRKPTISDDYQVYNSEEVQMEGHPTSFEEAMRSSHSSE